MPCSGPKESTTFIHKVAQSYHAETQRQALVNAYRSRNYVKWDRRQSLNGLYEATVEHVAVLRSLVARCEGKSSLARSDVDLSMDRTVTRGIYMALLHDFRPDGSSGMFSADRLESPASKHYSNIATGVRAVLPLAQYSAAPLVDSCVLSLLSLYVGLLHGNAQVASFARSNYTSALRLYSQSLAEVMIDTRSEEAARLHRVFLHATFALQMFEHLHDVDVLGDGYLAHSKGAINLLRLCGPDMIQQSSDLRQALAAYRGVAMYIAIDRREHSLLMQPEWLQIYQTPGSTARDRSNELGLVLAPHLKAADELLARAREGLLDPVSTTNECLRLLQVLSEIHRRLEEWYYQLKLSFPTSLFWSIDDPVIKPMDSQDPECMSKYRTDFHGLEFSCGPIAGLLAQHWSLRLETLTMSMELNKAIVKYAEGSASPTVAMALQSLERDRVTAHETADLIMQAEPRLASCFEGLLCLQFPMRIVDRYRKSVR